MTKGKYYVHRATGELVRVARVGRQHYAIERKGIGLVAVDRDTFHRQYDVAASPEQSTAVRRVRREAHFVVSMEQVPHGWMLTIEPVREETSVESSVRFTQIRYRDPAEAAYWFEQLRSAEDVRRLAPT